MDATGFFERRRTWRERLFTRPWRPWVAWKPVTPIGRAELDDEGRVVIHILPPDPPE